VSDGRSYTYDWSGRGELLVEETQGADVRTFAWDAAGRLVQATVFTRTTHFTYTGDGTRVAVEVEGQGTTDYVTDQGGQILVESTAATSTLYLYGRECLGEVRDGALLYYLSDGAGYVRQVVDADGTVVDTWLYTPDGGVMAGPEGPVTHLVCGGVCDWSTGLIYRGGRYFDPALGIWLALGPLVVVQGWRERKRKGRRGALWYVLLLVVVAATVGGQIIQEVNFESSDPQDYSPFGRGMPRQFWESWPVARLADPPRTWRHGVDPYSRYLWADDAFTVGDAAAPSGYRQVEATVSVSVRHSCRCTTNALRLAPLEAGRGRARRAWLRRRARHLGRSAQRSTYRNGGRPSV
jgi:YD repeat-containing protein